MYVLWISRYSIQKEHAVITNEGGKAFIEKVSPMAKLLVNGDPITSKMELDHNDRYSAKN